MALGVAHGATKRPLKHGRDVLRTDRLRGDAARGQGAGDDALDLVGEDLARDQRRARLTCK
jgi:hypothetical protein